MLGLYAVYECSGDFTCKIRIFRIVLEIAAAQRRTLNVDCRTEDNGNIVCLRFPSDGTSHFVHQITVKGAGGEAGRREADRLDAVVHAEMVAFVILLAQSVRAVTDHYFRDAEPVDVFEMPEIQSGAHAGFFLQCHLTDDFFQIVCHKKPPIT